MEEYPAEAGKTATVKKTNATMTGSNLCTVIF
jgi:hypothetical protein